MKKKALSKARAFIQESIKRLPFALGILLVLLLVQGYQNAQASEANARATHDIIQTLAKQSKQRDKNLQKLIDDNAQQTLILCSLIINNNNALTAAQVADVQAICKQRINQASSNGGASASSGAGTTPASSASTNSSSSQNAPPKPQTQSNPSQPPKPVDEGLVPDVIPLIGPAL